MSCDDVARKLAESAVFASSGDFYATTVCDRFGIDSLLRIGCACYTTDDEVARLLAAVGAL
jgi:selenocysteine lyase/cysteine desulfurase